MNARAIATIALAAGALGTASCGGHSSPPPPPPVEVAMGTIERRTMATYESLDGQVDPFLSANLAPQQSGTLVAIYANEGDRVRKGETLAKIDDSILRANLTQQQGATVQSVAKLAQSKIQLPITNVSYSAALVQAERNLEQAKKTQTADAANVANTKLTFEADASLMKQGYVAESVYEMARAAYVAAQQTLASDTDKLAQDQAAVREAKQNLDNTPLQQQVIAENRGAVTQAEGSVAQYQTAVSQTTIVAPFDGVVTARTLDPGSFASPTESIFSISQLDPIYVDFNVHDTDLSYVSPGAIVSFSTSANPSRRYDGRVASVDSVPQTGTLLYRARIIEKNPDFSLRGGLQVTVRVTKDVHPNVLTVPRAAVVQDGSSGTIYTVRADGDHDVAKETKVKLGLQTGDYVEVSGSGIAAGTRIVSDQTDNLHDGLAVATPGPSPSPSGSP